MTTVLRSSSVLALIAGFGAGCMIEEGDDVAGGDDQTSEVTQAAGVTCSPWVCGSNDPDLSVYFHELSVSPAKQNAEGLSVLGFDVGAAFLWNVGVKNGELYAWKPGAPLVQVTGAALIGKSIKIKNNNTGNVWRIRVNNVTSTPLWPAGSGSMPAYELKSSDDADPDHNEKWLCSNPDSLLGEYDTLNQNKWTVVLFEGDRFSATSKTITGWDKTWFNVGCAGHVLAKLALTHHTTVTSKVGGPAYLHDQREDQAMMKMYTADYCGDGTAFTVGGTELGWIDSHAWSPYYYPILTLKLEARWTDVGPSCLQKPRLVGTADPLAINLFGPDINAAIDAHCGATRPKKCSDIGESTDVTKLYEAMFVSAKP
jgi:hypothetical protein